MCCFMKINHCQFQGFGDIKGNKCYQSQSHYSSQRGLIPACSKNYICCKNEHGRLGFPPSSITTETLPSINPPMTDIFYTVLFWPLSHQFFPFLPFSTTIEVYFHPPLEDQQVGSPSVAATAHTFLVRHKWFKLTMLVVQTRSWGILIKLSWRRSNRISDEDDFGFTSPALELVFSYSSLWNRTMDYELLTTHTHESLMHTVLPLVFAY